MTMHHERQGSKEHRVNNRTVHRAVALTASSCGQAKLTARRTEAPLFDTADIVRDIIKQRGDGRTPLERQVVDLLKSMVAAGLTEHCAFDALYQLYGYLTIPGELEHELFIHRRWEGELVEAVPGVYVDMVKAEALYRRWCRTNGVNRASMARNAKVVDGRKQDAPCLVFVAGKLKLPTYVVAKAWKSRKKLTS